MPGGFTALALLAQAAGAPASYGPASAPPPKKPPAAAATAPACPTPRSDPNSYEIVICALRVDGYRIDPDVMEARRALRGGGRPTPHGPANARPNDCAVGPMGCGPQAGINLVGAALTAAEMAKRLTEGKEIGSMFVTDPHPTEYQLYLLAKTRREVEEADKAAKAKAAAVAAAGPQPVRYPTEPKPAER